MAVERAGSQSATARAVDLDEAVGVDEAVDEDRAVDEDPAPAGAIPLRDPRTGHIERVVDAGSADDVRSSVRDLRRVQPAWRDLGVAGRCDVLRRWADALKKNREDLVAALVADTGRLYESRLEVDAVVGGIHRWAGLTPDLLPQEQPTPASFPAVTIEQDVDPYPVVGAIGPWNFPLLLSLIDAVPALAAGCAVLVKPSEITPRFVPVLEAITSDIEPLSRVLDFVVGGPAVGEAVVDAVDAVCFTGSVPTGRKVALHAAERLIPAYLELGGKDPAVVLASADLDVATEALLWASTANAGQSCLSIERIYVDRSIHDRFVDRLVERAEAVPLAHPTPADGMIGPIIAERQIATIRDHVADAVGRGAELRTGGVLERLDGGTYLRPTVLTGVDHSMRIMTEETFGPIMPVAAFDEIDEAVDLANDTEYGLSAAVFGEPSEARRVAARIRAGAVSVNDAGLTAIVHDGEKNAYGSSGLGGTRMGPGALRRFVRRRAYLVKDPTVRDPWWYPQPAGATSNEATDNGADA